MCDGPSDKEVHTWSTSVLAHMPEPYTENFWFCAHCYFILSVLGVINDYNVLESCCALGVRLPDVSCPNNADCLSCEHYLRQRHQ